MTRYHFDDIDGTVDEIDTDEELRREEAREEAEAEDCEAFLEREYTRTNEEKSAKFDARLQEIKYWHEQERRKWELADKLIAQAYKEDYNA